MSAVTVKWIDRGVEPKSPPSPAFPDGVDLDFALGAPSCTVSLPYPAKRCGYYVIACTICGQNGMITTAGRADDPKSVKIPCKLAGSA